jgi:hypothetical protein
VLAATWGGTNQTGMWTFLILWVMRQSAKLNVFLGVRNLNEGFLPDHLKYLQTYFTRRPMNRLFPVSVIISTLVAALIWQEANLAGKDAFEITALTFAATLLTLAVLEHWFLVLPLPFETLWNWGLRSRKPGQTGASSVGSGESGLPALPVVVDDASRPDGTVMKSVRPGIGSESCISY